jgi:hypothetical protein
MMRPPPLHGINGRLRQHITKLGGAYVNGIIPPKAIVRDACVIGMLDSGSLTKEQLQRAVDGYIHIPSYFACLQEIEDHVLDRADNVFLAKYGREPTEDSDFRRGGDYHKICKNLEGNWHHYNADLEKLGLPYAGQTQPAQPSTSTLSVEEIVCRLLQDVLGDVIPPPKKERKKRERDILLLYPCYKIDIRLAFPDYDSNSNRNARIHGKLSDMANAIQFTLWNKHHCNYVDIARIPTVLVRKVACQRKPNASFETVFQNWP